MNVAHASCLQPVVAPQGFELLTPAGRSERCKQLAKQGYLIARVGPVKPPRSDSVREGSLRRAIEGAVEMALALRGASPPSSRPPAGASALKTATDQLERVKNLAAPGLCLVLPSLYTLALPLGHLEQADSEILRLWSDLASREPVVVLIDISDRATQILAPVRLEELFSVAFESPEEPFGDAADDEAGDEERQSGEVAGDRWATAFRETEPAGYDAPIYAEPIYAEPIYAEPNYAEPSYAEPNYAEPSYAEPVYAEPVYAEPALKAAEALASYPVGNIRDSGFELSNADDMPEPDGYGQQAGAAGQADLPHDEEAIEVALLRGPASLPAEPDTLPFDANLSHSGAARYDEPESDEGWSSPGLIGVVEPAERAESEHPSPPPPILSPEATRRYAEDLMAAAGPKPVSAIEEIFRTRYAPLLEALSCGLGDPAAREAVREWSSSFAKSYSDGFSTMRVTGKRPRMVLDAPEAAARLARLNGARVIQLLLVDGLRFDLGERVMESLKDRVAGQAICVDSGVLWAALPTTTPTQLHLLGRGPRGLREPEPVSEREPAVFRGKSINTLRRVRIGQRDLVKLDLVEARLREAGAPFDQRMSELAEEASRVIAHYVESLNTRTLLYVFGDHGFQLSAHSKRGTNPASQGGASPEEVLVPAYAWLVEDVH